MSRILLVTNDFPPRPGGIQSYLQELVNHLVATGEHTLTVYAPKWKGCEEFDAAADYEVVRHPTTLMLPEPTVIGRMRRLIEERDAQTVWFGAAAPLALMAPLARDAGAHRVIASTHGHEVGWSMLPLARTALRRIGNHTDVITYVSNYTRGRFASAFGPRAALEHLPPGVDTDRFAPDEVARAELRARYRLGGRPVVVCVSRLVPRKGQDMLIRALPAIRQRVPGAALVIVGGGPYRNTLRRLAHSFGVAEHVVFTDGVPAEELPAHHAMGDVFAMPCRTRGAGLDVEGLGIVFLEASASGVPVVAGRSGGAPETVRDGETGVVVDGWDVGAIAAAVSDLLADPDRAARMGAAGRRWVVDQWQWSSQAAKLSRLL
ncbi:glycosyltransferase [Mycolicibacterium phlei]|jgi:phosphatidylinositol alpha-1,6-mannosyltransferase|uniref:GDP-mannose-dependent alpha-(1-6)-phosphatidylinositol monomannoside mannosyltransferase n=1 Tax=Mycolicibacterium phlei DSM 43239 = CCUG 21000 TaxID=1226750 RepID=A0A5N5V529_MYCPH|nr:glycosyltransferase family 4 protein [Mycolicibacterium phlei]VEG10228.1 glycosyltransferase [Mycobacteroides chelonae]AMO62123.1 GDP-mannose-dependent alpha-(1-6)-phosphatidylinositol monomannoside mannosyltransferase [Mycolicibacterium phlei]EID14281.1 glycosyltransferase [Mycolicibacterium phlei RIVM601174]KAB7757031.1 GDP-mannose-dependent alpha-(1-6)-phosphatidylinositol monomannoside mannosyltransferase [Mycolicibacterium phlei DSM 43239 = CCUG 21000]KXW62566.1 GDP-mannose-dependent a